MKNTMYAGLAAVAIAMLAPAAEAAVTLTPVDSDPDGSFTFGVAGSNVSHPTFEDFVDFTVSTTGFINSLIGTSATQAVNDVDFNFIQISGGTLAAPAQFFEVSGDPNEVRAINDLAVGAGTYRLTINGTSPGANGSYGGSLAFRAASAVPEPATWAMMLIGFGAVGYSLRRRSAYRIAQAV